MKLDDNFLESLRKELEAFGDEEKPDVSYTAKDIVSELSPVISELLKANFSVDQIYAFLESKGLKISESTFKLYLSQTKPKKKKSRKAPVKASAKTSKPSDSSTAAPKKEAPKPSPKPAETAQKVESKKDDKEEMKPTSNNFLDVDHDDL